MPIKRGGQTRSNAGKYAPEGQGATQRGGRLRTPSGRTRPTQTARLPQATAPGTVTRTGASRAPAMQAQGMSRGVGRLGIPLAIVAEVMRAQPAKGALPASESRRVEAQRTQGAEFSRQERVAREGNKGRENSSFDDAFADARKAGVETFTWKGRKYTTKMKGEK
jgi:hypothetical protein